MNIWLVLTFIFAFLEALAVSRNLPKLEYIAKPGVMVYLFLWLYFSTSLHGSTFWFGVGILFSLVGDVLLMNPTNTMFLAGLVAFLFAHLIYVICCNVHALRPSLENERSSLCEFGCVFILYVRCDPGME